MPLNGAPHPVPLDLNPLPPPAALDVPWQVQAGYNWCWAASAAMVMTFYKLQVDQCALAEEILKAKGCCGHKHPEDTCDLKCQPGQVAELYGKHGMLAQMAAVVDPTAWEPEITARRPVEIGLRLDVGTKHLVVVRWAGTDAGVANVVLRDPLHLDDTRFTVGAAPAVTVGQWPVTDAWTGIEVDPHAAHG